MNGGIIEKVCLVGSGNWGSCIGKMVGTNIQRLHRLEAHRWHQRVNMWVYEEMIDGKPLTEIINSTHENVKYLPGVKLPENVVAMPDLEKAIEDATLLIFVLPHQFIRQTCKRMVGRVTKGARAISLTKGLDTEAEGLTRVSSIIADILNLDVSVLMGANLATDLAKERFSEATIGFSNAMNGATWKELFEQPTYFRLSLIEDVAGVELCGALKNIIAVAAGIVDGIYAAEGGGADNTKAALIRRGLLEMRLFCRMVHAHVRDETFLESCGLADVVTSSYGGRNRRVAEALVKTKRPLDELEEEMLHGQKLQGPPTAHKVYQWLKEREMAEYFPIMVAVYRICYELASPRIILDALTQ